MGKSKAGCPGSKTAFAQIIAYHLDNTYQYHYVFLGAGAATLSLLCRMKEAGLLREKKILVIDRKKKDANDRTWCFWENTPGFFEPVVYRQWEHLSLFGHTCRPVELPVMPYRYKMIRGIDFYRHCQEMLKSEPGIEWLYGEIDELSNNGGFLSMKINGALHRYSTGTVFNSTYNEAAARKTASLYLLQHFTGWVIETPEDRFDANKATLMDFRAEQSHGPAFAYVLPLSNRRALVEYTLFTEAILTPGQYHLGLRKYIGQTLGISQYILVEAETGVIPMTDALLPVYHQGMYHIGMAGGQTKASSGYTFQFIQRQSAQIVDLIAQNKLSPQTMPGTAPARFRFYDRVLLRVLKHRYAPAEKIFTTLFRRNPVDRVFRFLDNQTSRVDELRIILSLPVIPFLRGCFPRRRKPGF